MESGDISEKNGDYSIFRRYGSNRRAATHAPATHFPDIQNLTAPELLDQIS